MKGILRRIVLSTTRSVAQVRTTQKELTWNQEQIKTRLAFHPYLTWKFKPHFS